ncbi:MAG: hypothetical protein ABEI80_03270 [Haloplanus sp.]
MATGAAFVLIVALLLAVAVPLVVYALVDEEAENTRRMDRASAEQAARRDTDESERDTTTRNGSRR